MDFNLNSNQKLLQSEIKNFSLSEIEPVTASQDEENEFPGEIIQKMRELGIFGVTVEEAYGGSQLDFISFSILVEELSKASASIGVSVVYHNIFGGYFISKFGTEEQRRKYLKKIAGGEKLCGFGMVEPDTDSPQSLTAALEKDEYHLNGSINFAFNAGLADLIVVAMPVQGGANYFLIENGFPGFKSGKKADLLGIRGAGIGDLIFENCKVPASNFLSTEGAPGALSELLSLISLGIASVALGLGQASIDASIKYSKQRKQFNQYICQFQLIQKKLADMDTEISASRFLTYHTAYLKDSNKRILKETSQAKLLATESARRAAIQAVQIFGGYGYMKDFPVERYMRDAKVLEVIGGTSDTHRINIAKILTGKVL